MRKVTSFSRATMMKMITLGNLKKKVLIWNTLMFVRWGRCWGCKTLLRSVVRMEFRGWRWQCRRVGWLRAIQLIFVPEHITDKINIIICNVWLWNVLSNKPLFFATHRETIICIKKKCTNKLTFLTPAPVDLLSSCRSLADPPGSSPTKKKVYYMKHPVFPPFFESNSICHHKQVKSEIRQQFPTI